MKNYDFRFSQISDTQLRCLHSSYIKVTCHLFPQLISVYLNIPVTAPGMGVEERVKRRVTYVPPEELTYHRGGSRGGGKHGKGCCSNHPLLPL